MSALPAPLSLRQARLAQREDSPRARATTKISRPAQRMADECLRVRLALANLYPDLAA